MKGIELSLWLCWSISVVIIQQHHIFLVFWDGTWNTIVDGFKSPLFLVKRAHLDRDDEYDSVQMEFP
jgi:hypothetical protein